jgi:hypothetical protein
MLVKLNKLPVLTDGPCFYRMRILVITYYNISGAILLDTSLV